MDNKLIDVLKRCRDALWSYAPARGDDPLLKEIEVLIKEHAQRSAEAEPVAEIEPEYDFSNGVRGKYYREPKIAPQHLPTANLHDIPLTTRQQAALKKAFSSSAIATPQQGVVVPLSLLYDPEHSVLKNGLHSVQIIFKDVETRDLWLAAAKEQK